MKELQKYLLTALLSLLAHLLVVREATALQFAAKHTGILLSTLEIAILALALVVIHSYETSSKLKNISARKEKIAEWKIEIAAFNGFNEFKNTHTYMEIKSLMKKDELLALKEAHLNKVTVIDGGAFTSVETPETRLINLFKSVICRLQKQWGIL